MKIKLLITSVWLAVALLCVLFVRIALADFNIPLPSLLKSLNGSQNSPAFSVIEISDLHAASACRWDITNTVNTIIANKALWNVKMVISAGDLFDQISLSPTNAGSTWWQSNNYPYSVSGESLTNWLWQLKAAGIPVMAVQGNHDSDDTLTHAQPQAVYWTNVFGTAFYAGDPYYFTNYGASWDTRAFAMKFRVGNCNMLFIGLPWFNNNTNLNPADAGTAPGQSDSWPHNFVSTNETIAAYSGVVAWASNLALAYPGYNVIPVCHYFIGTNGLPGYKDLVYSPDVPDNGPTNWSPLASGQYVCEGPGLSLWNAMKGLPNLCAFMSGHVRQISQVVSFLQCDDGHTVAAIKFNTQGGLNGSLVNGTGAVPANAGVFTVYTFYPASGTVSVRNYGHLYLETNFVSHGTVDRFLLNGEVSQRVNNLSNQWTFPLAVKSF